MSRGENSPKPLFPQALPLPSPLPGAGCRQGRKPRRAAFPHPARLPDGRRTGFAHAGRPPGGVRSTLDGGVPAPMHAGRRGRAWGEGGEVWAL